MRTRSFCVWLVVGLLVILIGTVAFAQGRGLGPDREVADLVLHNAKIYTMDENNPVASSIAIKDDKILAVGHRNVTAKVTGPGTEIINLEEATVLPGLIDSHVHLPGLGLRLLMVDAHWLPKEEILQNVADAVEEAEPVEWIRGRGYNEAVWDPPEPPTRHDLDTVSPENPVIISRYCGHAVWVNTMALQIAEIYPWGPNDHEGIHRDEDGYPTGVLIGGAPSLIWEHVPPWTDEQIKEGIELAGEECVSVGLTGVHEASRTGLGTVEMMKSLYEEEALKLRVYEMLSYGAALELGEPQIGLYNNRYTIRSVKHIMDGALGARSAAFIEEYSDAPGHYGYLYTDEDTMTEIIVNLYEIDFQIRSHAIGTLGNRTKLNAIERANEKIEVDDPRPAIEHAQIIHLNDIPRFAELDVIASMQPLHATEDMLFAEDRVGPERILGGYAWRTLLDQGTIIAGGSDAPVSPINPFYSLHAAVTRQDRDNKPEGGWFPEQAVTREEALRMFTLDAAYAAFEEDIKGSLEPGKLADLVVIEQDVMDPDIVADEDIWKVEVLKTIIGGEVVYEKE